MTVRVLIGLVLLATPLHAASGQSVASPIGDLLQDANGDRIPDALGMTVSVTGRASSSSGAFGPEGPSFTIQDATGGLAVTLDASASRTVTEGDSIGVTGVFDFVQGMAVLHEARVVQFLAAQRPVAPIAYLPANPEAVEGQLVEVQGVVVGSNRVQAGQSLSLTLEDRSLLVAFVYAGSPEALSIDAYEPGDRVRIVGIAGQYDRVAPYKDSYQIYPRRPQDIHRAGIPTEIYRQGVLVVLGLLGVAVAWVTVLRRQVQRRVNQLTLSEDRYRNVVNLASDAIAIHDLEGNHIELNRAARDAIGCGPEDTPPALFDVVLPEHHQRVRTHIARLQKKGTSRAELRLQSVSGPRVFEFDSQLITLDGQPRVLSLARDVDVRLDYETGLIEARERAEEMARAKSAFLASMSHEIRTPLTAVIGFADLLKYEVTDDQLDLVLAIQAGGTRLLNTLNSVLDLAQIDAGGQTLRPRPLDLVEHVHRSLDVLRPMAENQGLALHLNVVDATLPASLDHGALDRILNNLIGNAVKFTDEGSVTVRLRQLDGRLELAVTDTGIGIDAEFLPDLFSEFRQESEGHARSHEGSGLGLAITERLVRLMNGSISVASEKGVGTTFTVTVPHILPEPEPEGAMLVTNADRQLEGDAELTLADILG
ncbi:MAG: ATP-binding protein [Rubricoccaceae bacterium]